MKRFLKESGGVSEYPDVTIEWIRHHNPDLAIYQNGVKIQTIDLSPYKYNALHELFASHFSRRGTGRALAAVEASVGAQVRAAEAFDEVALAGATAAPAINPNTSTSTSNSTPAPRSSHDAALPQPVVDGWQAADLSMIVGAGDGLLVPHWTLVYLLAALALVALARCVVLQRRPPKHPALDV